MRNMVDKASALNHVNAVCLATLETALFLDTHPDNCEAMENFNNYNTMCQQAKMEYSKRFGPLTWAQAGGTNEWQWVNQPWPWEGGNC